MKFMPLRIVVVCALLAPPVLYYATVATQSPTGGERSIPVTDLGANNHRTLDGVTQTAAPADRPNADPPTASTRGVDPTVPGQTAPGVSTPESTEAKKDGETRDSDPALVLRNLSASELADLARGKAPSGALAKRLLGSSERLEDLLLDEMSRRIAPSNDHVKVMKPSVADTTQRPTDQAVSPFPHDEPIDKQVAPEPIRVEREKVVASLAAGKPMSVCVVELTYKTGHGPILYPDQPLFLSAGEPQTYYVTFDVTYQNSSERSPWEVDRIEVSFLVRDQGPLHVQISTLDAELLEPTEVQVTDQFGRFDAFKKRWWDAFSRIPDDLGDEQRVLRLALNEILARRYSLAGPWPVVEKVESEKSNGLEEQFERAVGMLFGMESVKLAMQNDVTLNQSARAEKANQPVPAKPRMASVVVPNFREVQIEPIALHVPEECFYLRTGSLQNYQALRGFLDGWGGNLSDVVTTGSVVRQTRKKAEFQLALHPDQTAAAPFDQLISDMTLIGCDPLFDDGAAMGVIFHAVDGFALADEIKRQRQQMVSTLTEVSESRVTVADHPVSFLATDDNRVRSFYAIDGPYHLVTNSEYILNRFFEAGRGDRSLGQLREFRYARSKADSSGEQFAFLYLSDPFFQNLVSPHYRIEMTRRSRALRELRQLQLAGLVAKSEQISDQSIDGLISANLLPGGFGQRPDGSQPTLKNRRHQDSLRGLPGSFVPIPDVQIDKATQSEVVSYRGFLRDYNQQWRRVDPVTVVFTKKGATANGLQQVGLEIVITPYARQKYALLERHLADASHRRFAPRDGDLLSVDTAVQMGRGQRSHLLYIGLRDDEIPFAMKNGEVKLLDQEPDATFAKLRSFAVISPPSTDILRMLGTVLLKGESLPSEPMPKTRPAPPAPLPLHALPAGSATAGQLLYYFGWALANMPPGGAEAAKYIKMIQSEGNLTAVAMDSQLRRDALDNTREENLFDPPKVRMHMGTLEGSKVEPYFQAYTFMKARRVSAANGRFLTDVSRWLNLSADEARGTIENILDAKLSCPLGGDFQMNQFKGQNHSVGTAWTDASLYELNSTPPSWKFPFLDWLRKLDLHFNLDETTLHAKVELTIRPTMNVADEVKLATQ